MQSPLCGCVYCLSTPPPRAAVPHFHSCSVTFRVKAAVAPGERVSVVGSAKALGGWDLSQAVPLYTSEDAAPMHFTHRPIHVALDGNVTYKYVVFPPSGRAVSARVHALAGVAARARSCGSHRQRQAGQSVAIAVQGGRGRYCLHGARISPPSDTAVSPSKGAPAAPLHCARCTLIHARCYILPAAEV